MKLFRTYLRLAGTIGLLLLIPSCVVISAGAGSSDRSPAGDSFAGVPEPGRRDSARAASLEVITDPEGAAVVLGYRRAGTTPLTLDDLEPGRYLVRVEKTGYYAEERMVSLERGETLVLDLVLDQIIGFLSVQANVSDLVIIADGTTYTESFIELPIGDYRVRIRRFGYEDVVEDVTIEPEQQTILDVALRPAPFALSDVEVSRSRFNPANPGLLGRTALTFEVSAPGSGVFRVRDELGRVVEEKDVGPFETWEQRVNWDGTDDLGQPLSEGLYELELDVAGSNGTVVVESTSVAIDPSLVVHYRSLWGGFSGLSFAPTAKALPPATFQVSAQGAATLFSSTDGLPDRYPIRFGLRAGLGGGLELTTFGGLVPTTEPTDTQWNVGGSLLFARSLSPQDAAINVAVGGLLQGVYQSSQLEDLASPDTFGSHAGVAFALPITLQANGLTATIAPELRLSPSPISYESPRASENRWTPYGYIRGGLLYDVAGLTFGVSGVARTRIDNAFEIVPVQAGFDASYVIPKSPVAVSFQAIAEWSGSQQAYFYSGVGLGLIF